jgi:hypothetical protein
MLLLAAATTIAAFAPESPGRRTVVPTVQARATVRILSGARLNFGGQGQAGAISREVLVRSRDGSSERARLIEFE